MTKDKLAKVFIAAGQAAAVVSKAKNKKSVFQTVKAFQALDGTLKVDGQWGINTRTAATWYLQREDIPDSAFVGGTLTWNPPDLSENAKDPAIAKKVAQNKSAIATKSKNAPTMAIKATPAVIQHVLTHDAPTFGQSSQSLGNNALTNDVESTIAHYLTKSLNPKISEIQKILKAQKISNIATQEHKKIVKSTDNNKQIVNLLKQILGKVNSQKVALDRRTLATIVI